MSADTAAATTPTVAKDEDFDLTALKKKKKKKSTKEAKAAVGGSADELADSIEDLNLGKKKKSSSKKKKQSTFDKELEKAGVSASDAAAAAGGAGADSERAGSPEAAEKLGLKYEELLERFFKILKTNNPELAGERSGVKLKIPPPVVTREPKKTIFANIKEISQKLHREPEHVIQYLFAELGTSGSVDGKNQLVIKGRFIQKQLEYVLKKYILEYVTCQTCKSINTTLARESANRLFFVVCNSCGSTRSVSSIKTGFQAHIGRRKRAA